MYSVCGVVVDRDAKPILSASVVIDTFWVAFTDYKGEFCIDGVSPGEHTVYALHRMYEKNSSVVDVNEDLYITITMGY